MMKDEIGIFHACMAQAFLGLLVVIALVTTNFWRTLEDRPVDIQNFTSTKTLAVAITIAIYVQLGLGATMRHQHRDLAILDFPTANGAWIPDTSAAALAKINVWRDARALSDVSAFQIWLQMVHRFLALIIRDRDNRVLRPGLERNARFRCSQTIITPLGRSDLWPDWPRCLGDLEQ